MRLAGLCTTDVVTAMPTERIVDIASRMREQHVGDVVIIASGADWRPIGILTDRDIVVTAVAERAEEIETLRATDIMSTDLVV
ncbi:MAG: CBS domain-containing protein, partial [Actinophytocola sp.]|nr:CBS domain-containing protein [Actinophytocola sp.]